MKNKFYPKRYVLPLILAVFLFSVTTVAASSSATGKEYSGSTYVYGNLLSAIEVQKHVFLIDMSEDLLPNVGSENFGDREMLLNISASALEEVPINQMVKIRIRNFDASGDKPVADFVEIDKSFQARDGKFTMYHGVDSCNNTRYRGMARLEGTFVKNVFTEDNPQIYTPDYEFIVDEISRPKLPLLGYKFEQGPFFTKRLGISNIGDVENQVKSILDKKVVILTTGFEFYCEGGPKTKLVRIF